MRRRSVTAFESGRGARVAVAGLRQRRPTPHIGKGGAGARALIAVSDVKGGLFDPAGLTCEGRRLLRDPAPEGSRRDEGTNAECASSTGRLIPAALQNQRNEANAGRVTQRSWSKARMGDVLEARHLRERGVYVVRTSGERGRRHGLVLRVGQTRSSFSGAKDEVTAPGHIDEAFKEALAARSSARSTCAPRA